MLKNLIVLGICLIGLQSCKNSDLYLNYHDFRDQWEVNEKVIFDLNPESTEPVNLMIYLRNDNRYIFSNIFIIATLKEGDKTLSCDTLEYAMADPKGEWLGAGFLELKESKLWWKEDFDFPQGENITATFEHAVRHGGSEKGIKDLEGIVGVGLSIEKTRDE
tara:strand:- start:424 stop:909 length:486 start_codon:yes stop_codon:yes gene_type:complete